MADEHDDDLEAEVDEGAEVETEIFVEASEDDEEPEVDSEENDASDTL